nr:hypothetical protein [Tanacetum cinerariifolium]
MGYLVRAYYSTSSTRYYKDDSCWSADVKSKTTEDIINNRSFMEVLVLNHYILVKNVILCGLIGTADEALIVGLCASRVQVAALKVTHLWNLVIGELSCKQIHEQGLEDDSNVRHSYSKVETYQGSPSSVLETYFIEDNSLTPVYCEAAENDLHWKKHGRMMLDSIDNGLLVYPTVEEDGQTRPKKYSELTEAQQIQDDCDVQATNIILHGLPPDVYALVNHQETANDIWYRVKLLMKGTELSYQERKCRLYNLFDKFASQVQVNTKFLNALPPEWSKFVTNVKLAKSLYTTNYDQLYAYLSQHERHANQQGEDPIDCINKEMAFLSAVASRPHGEIVHSAKEAKKFCVVQGEVDVSRSTRADCDDISSAKAVLMANLLSRDSDVLSEVPYFDTYLNDMINQEVQEMPYSQKTHIVDFPDNKITSEGNIDVCF